ncbi:MAG: TetR/AcrR family transcriptional regulator [Myxococcales bacterium]|nr:TetR/AcrR family transcriptional regulator [Myxococcales bacterium]
MARPVLTEAQVDAFRARATHVALDLFVSEGYARFSLRGLASALGCSHATPYRYFPGGKSEIFAAVRAEGFRRFAAALRHSQVHVVSAEARLRRMAQAYFDFATEQPAAFAVIFQMGEPEGAPDVELADAATDAWSVVMECVQHAADAHVITGDVLTIAHTMWAGMHGVASLHSAHTLAMGRTAPEILHAMVEALLRAHRPQEQPHG